MYVLWGSTYLAIAIAIETLPPLVMSGSRFALAGAIVLGWARARGAAPLGARQWRASAAVGLLLLVVGNGGVVLAERTVPTGMAAIVVAMVPGWAVLFGARRARPTRRQVVGLLLGFAGVAWLSLGGDLGGAPIDLLVLFLAPIGWAAGSVFATRLGLPGGLAGAGSSMLLGGLEMIAAGLLTGERLAAWPSTASLLAVLYLFVFGSLVAFSAYRWLLEHTTPAVATSNAFVNPVVALLLGAALAGEQLSARGAAAGAMALAGVVLIVIRPPPPA